MELRQLRYFVAVADHGTYVAAASALRVAQPALWRQVHDLEAELGTALFERAGRRVRLTAGGRELREVAASAIAAADRVERVAGDIRTASGGTLSIACAAPHLREILAAVIARFRAHHPDVRISVREYLGGPGPGQGLLADLLDGSVDLTTGVPPGETRVDSILLYRSRIALVVPDDHPWRHRALVDVAELAGVALVSALPGSFSRNQLDAAARRRGFEPEIAFESPNPVSIVALGRAGIGLSVLVEDAVDHPTDPAWPALADGGRAIAHEIRLGWRAGAPQSAAAKAFVTLAGAEVERRSGA